ncbi:MAG: glycosyltransferase family 4 protein [Acidobacteriota bacterium]|nr:glycosyltransferase family 4 protein [Acidobacteriota bacterium]
MKKVLYIATSDVHIRTFHLPFLKWLKENGCIIHLAAEKRGDVVFDDIDQVFYMPFPRSPLNRVYFSTYNKLKMIIDQECYDLVHCHTPLPSFIGRLAARSSRKKGTKVLYTVHGFHFFKGAPLKNWLIYYPAEWFMSFFTDAIITMNSEDFSYINEKMPHKKTYIIPGMGVDPKKFHPFTEEEKIACRKKLGFDPKSVILLYVAEFIPRKNHELIIPAIKKTITKNPNVKVIFAGKGPLIEKIKKLAVNVGLDKDIEFLGFRDDIPELTGISDIGISASRHEGLPISLLQEMFCGLPVVAPIERGHNELIADKENGFLYPQNDHISLAIALQKLIDDPELRVQMGKKSLKRARLFSIENSLKAMAEIYEIYLS